MIKIYNSLTKQVEIFTPIKENEVSMYVCGPTVYDSIHIGNSRPIVFFDTVARFFTFLGYKVTYVSNYTDIDDRIIIRAKEEGVSEENISRRYIEETNQVIEGLNCLPYNKTPLVTESISSIISFIKDIIDCGGAYIVDGDVYFDISKVENYGILSSQAIDSLISGARVDPNEKKRSPLDFNLWKETKEGKRWLSPWSWGRPGWHSECVVMIEDIFNGKIDIHGGGNDLKFPHHENEIAQSVCLHNHMIANYWMHNGMIDFSGEKMSKSLGNYETSAKELLDKITYPVYRLIILNVPYRQPLSFKEELIRQAENDYQKIYRSYISIVRLLELSEELVEEHEYQDLVDLKTNFINAMKEDFNTTNALSVIHQLVKLGNTLIRSNNIEIGYLKQVLNTMKDLLWILGIEIEVKALSKEDKMILKLYYKAKAEKDYKLSDQLRKTLIDKGILL